MKTFTLVIGGLIVGLLLLLGTLMGIYEFDTHAYRQIMIGDSERAVVDRVGTPDAIVSKQVGLRDPGWQLPSHPISNKVYLYDKGEHRIYVFLDSHERVEHVFIGGS